MGIQHDKLSYRPLGLDQRLTGVEERSLSRMLIA
jgi:hypothetical protein